MEKILRTALLTKDTQKRDGLLHELRDSFPMSKERIFVECGIKDSKTTPQDFDDIVEGKHYDNYKKSDVKAGMLKENILNPQVSESESGTTSVRIMDSYGTYKDLEININLDKFINLKAGSSAYGNINDGKSNKKIMKALEAFNKLTNRDKQDIKNSIKMAEEALLRKKEKNIDKKSFVDAINEQLSPEERQEFIGLLMRQINDTFGNSFNNN